MFRPRNQKILLRSGSVGGGYLPGFAVTHLNLSLPLLVDSQFQTGLFLIQFIFQLGDSPFQAPPFFGRQQSKTSLSSSKITRSLPTIIFLRLLHNGRTIKFYECIQPWLTEAPPPRRIAALFSSFYRLRWQRLFLSVQRFVGRRNMVQLRYRMSYCKEVSCIAPWGYMIFCSRFGGYIRGNLKMVRYTRGLYTRLYSIAFQPQFLRARGVPDVGPTEKSAH